MNAQLDDPRFRRGKYNCDWCDKVIPAGAPLWHDGDVDATGGFCAEECLRARWDMEAKWQSCLGVG